MLRRAKRRDDAIRQAFAACAVEAKGVEQRGAALAFHRLTQPLPGAMYARLDRLWLQAECLGGLLDAHPLDHSSNEHSSERIRQVVDRSFEQTTNFFPSHKVLRIRSVCLKRCVVKLDGRPSPIHATHRLV